MVFAQTVRTLASGTRAHRSTRLTFSIAGFSGAGFASLVTVPAWQAGIVGYALVGAGCSNIVPVLYSATGRQRTMPEHTAIPAISTLGYTGILAGPAAVGFIAHASSLAAAFGPLALLLVGVSASSRRLTNLT